MSITRSKLLEKLSMENTVCPLLVVCPNTCYDIKIFQTEKKNQMLNILDEPKLVTYCHGFIK